MQWLVPGSENRKHRAAFLVAVVLPFCLRAVARLQNKTRQISSAKDGSR